MPRNVNIQTVQKRIITGAGAATRTAIASSVPAGMTRYVTYLRLQRNSASNNEGSRIWLCSGAAAGAQSTTALASVAQKLTIELHSAVYQPKTKQIPAQIDTENPLFTIAASKFLNVFKSALAIGSEPATLFVQYYDQ